MRVLHLISSGGMYGAEAVILNLASQLSLSEQGSAIVATFAHAGKPAPELYTAAIQNGIKAELVPCKGQADLSVLKAIRSVVERSDADVVHAHGYKADIYASLAWRGMRRPALVSTCHNWIDSDLVVKAYGAADRWVLRNFDRVIAVSEEIRHRLTRAGVAASKITLIQNGILTAPFSAARIARGRDVGRAELRVGLVGRLGPEKGIDVFLRAAAYVASELPHVRFVVAGEGPVRAQLADLIQELGLGAHASLLGSQTNMPVFYASLDLLVLSSHYEGLPMVVLEGMASGLPVVATQVGQVPDVVQQGRTGLLVPPGNAEALAEAMLRLLRDSDMRAAYGDAGQQRVIEHFSAERMTTNYVEVYRQALATRSLLTGVPARTHG